MQFLAGTDILAELANYYIKLLIWQDRTNFLMVSFQGETHRNKTVFVIWPFVIKKESTPGMLHSY